MSIHMSTYHISPRKHMSTLSTDYPLYAHDNLYINNFTHY